MILTEIAKPASTKFVDLQKKAKKLTDEIEQLSQDAEDAVAAGNQGEAEEYYAELEQKSHELDKVEQLL